jgi:predicted RNA binding protein YcfA (HicA-like mRNA interferase family)
MDKKTLNRVLSGLADKNIRFQDITKLLKDLGFSVRMKGDHHIYYREGIEEIINFQPLKDGKAKAYQVKQVRVMIFKYKLHKGV